MKTGYAGELVMYPSPFPLCKICLVVLEMNCGGLDERTLPPLDVVFFCEDCVISSHLLICKFSGSNSSDFAEFGLLGCDT
jgi:hypothetical protein